MKTGTLRGNKAASLMNTTVSSNFHLVVICLPPGTSPPQTLVPFLRRVFGYPKIGLSLSSLLPFITTCLRWRIPARGARSVGFLKDGVPGGWLGQYLEEELSLPPHSPCLWDLYGDGLKLGFRHLRPLS